MKPNAKLFFSILFKLVPFALVFAVLLSVIFYPTARDAEGEEKRVIRVWNVDTFEGGKGSRTAFLKRTAAILEKKDKNIYYLISSYTAEGANDAFRKGKKPDILSYGVGLSSFAEKCVRLPYRFSGGETGEGCLAYPWCRGSYFLFSLTDDFESGGTCLISSGGQNLSEVSAALENIRGETVDSLSAYVAFLHGECRYLLGTQRDVCRFSSRGTEIRKKELTAYCDLYQYISVLSAEKQDDCMKFLNLLLSDEIQNTLSDIGMYSVRTDEAKRTISVFTDADALFSLRESAKRNDAQKNLDKFLKNI